MFYFKFHGAKRRWHYPQRADFFYFPYDTSCFEAGFNIFELSVKSFSELVATVAVSAERDNKEYGKKGFAEEVCTKNVSALEKREPGTSPV